MSKKSDLYDNSDEPRPLPEPEKEYKAKPENLKEKVLALIEKHFPAMDAEGHEAHQPLREFALELASLL